MLHDTLRRYGLFVASDAPDDGGSGGGGGPAPANDPPAPVPAPAPAPAPSGFTAEQQQEVARIAAREKDQGERAAAARFAEQLGMSPEEAKKLIDEKRAADLAAMSEADRIKAEGEAARAAAEAATLAAKRTVRDANVVVALASAGIAPELDPTTGALTGRASRIVKLLDLPDDADPTAIKTALDKLRTDEPALFGAAQLPPSGDPPGNPPGAQPTETEFDRGRKMAEAANAGNLPVFDPASFAR